MSIDKIRNIILLGHGGTGKTSLAEAMAFSAGVLDRFGKVGDGTTTSDYDPEEIKRQISISTSIVPFDWNNNKINIIDTPGYFDFVGEVTEGLCAADGAVIVVSGKSGVAVGTENAWEYAQAKGLPALFYINKMKSEHANFDKVLQQIKENFGTSIAPIVIPIHEGGKLCGFIDLISMKGYAWQGDKLVPGEIPASMADTAASMREELMETAAGADEELMEIYFENGELTEEELKKAVAIGVRTRVLTPVLAGSSAINAGTNFLMDALVDWFPAPSERGKIEGHLPDSEEAVSFETKEDAPLCAHVFKTVADNYGKISMFRVFSGTLTADSQVYNANKDAMEKIGRLYVLRGKKQIEVDKLVAGDIGAVTKLAVTGTGDTLCSKSNPIILPAIDFPHPKLTLAILPKAKGDEEKISAGLNKLLEEDPTFTFENRAETHQMVISGIGDQHLDVICTKLKSKFGVGVDLGPAKVPYRETIRKPVRVQGRHKKQSGGHGQFGDVWIEFEPNPDSTELVFEEKIFGGAVPKNFFPAVEKGLRECVTRGVLAGYPVVNLKATLVDGSYHPVDSSEMSFKMAASIAYRDGLPQASPVLLEPIGKLVVTIPDANMGDISGDINKRRGRVLGMNPLGHGKSEIEAEVPMSEMSTYASDLRSITQSRGQFTFEFVRYEQAPEMVAQKVIEESKKAAE